MSELGLIHGSSKPPSGKVFFDRAIYVVAFLVPISNLPQLYEIWINQEVAGVSLLSWSAFAVFSLFWAMYGFYHKDMPIMFQSFALIIIQVAIAVGIVVYS